MWVTANKMGNYMPYIYTYNRKIEKSNNYNNKKQREKKTMI